jgi:hypothetical protein
MIVIYSIKGKNRHWGIKELKEEIKEMKEKTG